MKYHIDKTVADIIQALNHLALNAERRRVGSLKRIGTRMTFQPTSTILWCLGFSMPKIKIGFRIV
jgi:hypothetical protein